MGNLRVLHICLVALAASIFIADNTVNAAYLGCIIKIVRVGTTEAAVSDPSLSGHIIYGYKSPKNSALQCPGWGTSSNQLFNLKAQNGDAMLATSLTAVSLGQTVLMVNSTADTYGPGEAIDRIYLDAP